MLGKRDPLMVSLYRMVFWIAVMSPFILLYILMKWLYTKKRRILFRVI